MCGTTPIIATDCTATRTVNIAEIIEQVREIKALLRDPDIKVAEVARRYGVSRTTLYKHVGVITPRQ
jgi:transposase-like protein